MTVEKARERLGRMTLRDMARERGRMSRRGMRRGVNRAMKGRDRRNRVR